MKNLSPQHYRMISEAISYITTHTDRQPTLGDIAQHCSVSSSSLQRVFSDYVGLSPKQFMMFLTTRRAKSILDQGADTLSTSLRSVLSGSGRLHDHFVRIESMTPGEYKTGGNGLDIMHAFHCTPYGDILIASTHRGICHMTFSDDHPASLEELRRLFPAASLTAQDVPIHDQALTFFDPASMTPSDLTLHLRGTAFQIKVWEALLQIPSGSLTSYGEIAREIGRDKAHRAVGTAVGRNPISYIIPCHRVIQASGAIGNYMWGPSRKKLILAHELD